MYFVRTVIVQCKAQRALERRQTEGNFAPVSSPGYRVINTHFVSVIKTSQLVLYKEIIAVYSKSHTKHTHTVWAEAGIFNIKLGGKGKVHPRTG